MEKYRGKKIIQFQIDNGLIYILTDDGKLYYGKIGSNKFARIKTQTL